MKTAKHVFRVAGEFLEQLLGPCGRTLRDVCVLSGADVGLRPNMNCTEDGFLLEVSGTEAAVEVVELWLRELFPADLPEELQSTESAPTQSEGLQGRDVAGYHCEEVEFPGYKADFILGTRIPGQGFKQTNAQVNELKELCGLTELEAKKVGMEEVMLLRARGDADALARFLDVITERMDACEDVLMEYLDVPMFKLQCLSRYQGGDGHTAKCDIEASTGVMITIKVNKQENKSAFCIRGTADQIERAKPLMLECISHHRGGKGKQKGKQNGESTRASRRESRSAGASTR